MDIDNYQKQNPPKHPTTGKLELKVGMKVLDIRKISEPKVTHWA